VPACAGVVSLPVVKISDSDDVFVAAAESTAVVPDLAVFRRESAEDQKRDSGLFTALLRRRSTSSSAGERKHGGRDLLHDAFIGRARQRHDLTGCDETRSVGAQPVRVVPCGTSSSTRRRRSRAPSTAFPFPPPARRPSVASTPALFRPPDIAGIDGRRVLLNVGGTGKKTTTYSALR